MTGNRSKGRQSDRSKERQLMRSPTRMKKFLIIFLSSISVIEIVCIVYLMVVLYIPINNLSKQLSLGEKYLEEMNYEEALYAYKTAIKIDEKCVAGYVGLAGSYIGMGNVEEALSVVETGIKNGIHSKDLKNLNDIINELIAQQAIAINEEENEINNGDSDNEDDSKDNKEVTEENHKQDEKKETKEKETEEKVISDQVDMKDYFNEWTEEYGGNLENKLAERLQTAKTYDPDAESYSLCDGKIEIIGATNGTGYFLSLKDKVDDFSIYGVSPGMSVSDAEKSLFQQGLFKQDNDDDPIYSTDVDEYYIMLDESNGIVSKVTYVRCRDRGDYIEHAVDASESL